MPAALPSSMSLWHVQDEFSMERSAAAVSWAAAVPSIDRSPSQQLESITSLETAPVDSPTKGRAAMGLLQHPTILGWYVQEEMTAAPAAAEWVVIDPLPPCASSTSMGRGDTREICGICLSVPDAPVELGCSHAFCGRCLMTAHDKHHNRCPVCRHEHVLDPIALRDKMAAYRVAYGDWRKGGVKGAHGELDTIGRVAIADMVVRQPKDTLLAEKTM